MSGKTKILVLHMKEVVYTGIFIFLGFIFLILLAVMFLPGRPKDAASPASTENSGTVSTENVLSGNASIPGQSVTANYTPGIYTASLEVSGSNLEMQVIIEKTGITDVSFTHLDETIETMYPLFTPVLENIATQLKNGTPLQDITYEDAQKYTANVLLKTLEELLNAASEDK